MSWWDEAEWEHACRAGTDGPRSGLYDPQVYGTYRVLRGGGWFDEHWSCRASVRRRSHPTLRLDDVGFRVALGPGELSVPGPTVGAQRGEERRG